MIRPLRLSVVFAFLLWIPIQVFAAPPVILEEGKGKYPLGLHLDILEDKEGKLTIEQVKSKEFENKWIQNKIEIPNFGITQSVYWVKFNIENLVGSKDVVLELGISDYDSVIVFFEKNNEIQVQKFGDLLPFYERSIKHRFFIVKLSLGQKNTIFIRYQTLNGMVLPVTLWEFQDFSAKDHEDQIYWGIYFGAILVIACYNFFLFLSIRDKTYLYYVIYIISFIIVQADLNGFAYEYLWPQSPKWENIAGLLAVISAIIFASLFCRSFLNTKKHSPLMDKALLSVTYISSIGDLSF